MYPSTTWLYMAGRPASKPPTRYTSVTLEPSRISVQTDNIPSLPSENLKIHRLYPKYVLHVPDCFFVVQLIRDLHEEIHNLPSA